jgi:hypothetical protein
MVGYDDGGAAPGGLRREAGNFPGLADIIRKGLLADQHRDAAPSGKAAVMPMAVRMCGYHKNLRLMDTEHLGGVGINRNLPFFRIPPPPFFIYVAARGKNTVRISGNCAGVGTWLLPQTVFFQDAANPAKPDNRGFNFLQ